MGRLKLFVSHSSRLDDMDQEHLSRDHNWKLLADTCALLRQEYGKSIEILVDQDPHGLYPGCDWEYRLNEWLAECHAAIILFSKRALTLSNWVKKEATILSWRHELDPNFTLIPVLLDGQVEPADLEKDLFGALRINTGQCVERAANATDIVEGIKDSAIGPPSALRTTTALTPFDKIERAVSKLLADSADAQILREVWEGLGDSNHKPEWQPSEAGRFSQALARYILRDGDKCLTAFQRVLGNVDIAPDLQHAESLLKRIRSLWVKAEIAGQIPHVIGWKKCLAVNGGLLTFSDDILRTKHFTLDRLIERAWPETDLVEVVTLAEPAGPEAVKDKIRERFNPSRAPIPITLIDRKIKERDGDLIVYMPASEEDGGIPDHRMLGELNRLANDPTFQRIIIIVGTGPSLPETSGKEIAMIDPALNVEKEYMQYLSEIEARKLLDRKYGIET